MKEARVGSDDGAAWRGFRNRLEVGQLVDGVVIEHRPLGAFVDIGNPHLLGLVEVASLDEVPGSRPGRKEAIYPAVGTRIRAVFLGFGNPTGRQPRLRLRQSAVRAADASKDAMIAALRAKITEVRARLARSGGASV
jgi:hypothetical protein